ncbi:hypothetical protein GF340_03545 [Candidatus Peregrinibacteria bacterium]|nr:hypothetical protein [Candidatus Peregrinibacteria bacterium]
MDNNTIYIIIGLVGFIVFIFTVVEINNLTRKKRRISAKTRMLIEEKIQKLKNGDKNRGMIELDIILTNLLKMNGLKGTTGEMLKNSSGLIKDYNSLWHAHKIRNKIAHEMDYKISEHDFKKNMNVYLRAFKDLGL